MKVYSIKYGEIILQNKAFASGGEGEVFLVHRCNQLQRCCVKIYNNPNKLLEQKIKYMVSNPPRQLDCNGFRICWPLDCVQDAGGHFCGFVMLLAFERSEKLIELTTTSIDEDMKSDWGRYFEHTLGVSSLANRIKLIHNIASPIHLLHIGNRYVLRDLKPENILVTPKGDVTLVDMDSVQINSGNLLLFPGNAATPNYIPPEFYRNKSLQENKVPVKVSWDRFSMAVVFYQLLFGLHPYVVTPKVEGETNEIAENISQNLFPFGDNAYKIKSYPPPHKKFSSLHPALQELFKRAFSLQVDNRPSAEEWGRATHTIITEYENSEIYRRQKEERLRREAEERRRQKEMRKQEEILINRAKTIKKEFRINAFGIANFRGLSIGMGIWYFNHKYHFSLWIKVLLILVYIFLLICSYFSIVDDKIKKYKEKNPDDPVNKYL